MPKYTKFLKEVNKKNISEVGGKGASLGEMFSFGIPVPNGFVVLARAFDDFLDFNELHTKIENEIDTIDVKNLDQIAISSKKIQKMILDGKISNQIKKQINESFTKLNCKYVAVRSSAIAEDGVQHAWAGQLDTFLNISRNGLLKNIKKCWASLFTERAIFYRFEKNLDKSDFSVAVVIQEMINSQKSGIAFSVHPVTQDRNQMVIEASFGLGEAIVSGSITPDMYVINKDDLTIIDKNIAQKQKAIYRDEKGENKWVILDEIKQYKQVLDEKQIDELSNMIIKIEKYYKKPQDIEWTYSKDGSLFITQSRPITTLDDNNEQIFDNINCMIIGNDIYKQITDDKEISGFLDSELIDFIEREEELFAISIMAGGFSSTKNAKSIFGVDCAPSIVFRNYNAFLVKSKADLFVSELNKKIKSNKKYIRDIEKKAIIAGEDLIEYSKNIHNEVSEELSNLELADILYNYQNKAREYTGFLLVASFESAITDLAKKLSKKYKSKDCSQDYIFNLITTPNRLTQIDKERDMFLKLACKYHKGDNIRGDIEKYLNDFGWINLRYWKGELVTEQDLLDRLKEITNPQEELDKRVQDRKIIEERLTKLLNIFSKEDIKKVEDIRSIVFLRTRRAEFLDESTQYVLNFLDIIARRLSLNTKELLYCHPIEIVKALRGEDLKLNTLIKDRQKDILVILNNNQTSTVFAGDNVKKYIEKYLLDLNCGSDSLGSTKIIKGDTAFPGIASGTVKIIKNNNDLTKVKKGDIMVSVMTFPSFIPAMEKCVAFVTDEGGILCHAAIIAREMKKPCIIGTKKATSFLKDEDSVLVDANKGIIKLKE